MGLKFIQRILVGFFVLNVLAVFLFTYYLASTIKEADLASTEASLHANENWIPLCEAEKDFVQNEQHNCSLLDKLSFEDYIASGWTKTVHRSRIGHIPVAIKSINIKGKDINDCVGTKPMLLCYNEAVNKFGREIDLLQKLNHTSIIKLLYYCYKTVGAAGCMKHAMVATELADPLSNIKLLQMSWRQRKLVIQGLASLIHYAETSPLGSLGIADLRRPQFVLIKGQLKLADLDDILVGEPTCFSDEDCSNLNITIPCISNRCVGYNVKLNIQKSYKEFAPYIFLHEDVPDDDKSKLQDLRHIWLGNNVSAKQLLHLAQQL